MKEILITRCEVVNLADFQVVQVKLRDRQIHQADKPGSSGRIMGNSTRSNQVYYA